LEQDVQINDDCYEKSVVVKWQSTQRSRS